MVLLLSFLLRMNAGEKQLDYKERRDENETLNGIRRHVFLLHNKTKSRRGRIDILVKPHDECEECAAGPNA